MVARIQAGPFPIRTNALLLVAHQDTVGVDAKKWTVDPFGATIRDGYLWGRGAIDDKAMLAANIATMVQLKRSNARLARDVIFLATDDEEQGGSASIKFAIEKYWDKIACAYALNEGGRVIVKDGKVQYVGVQASEKVSLTTLRSPPPAHPATARCRKPDNAVVHLAAAIEKLGNYQVPAQPSTITLRYFEQLSKVEDDEIAKWMRALEQPRARTWPSSISPNESPMWNSMLRDTIAPTMLQAGVRVNVVPSEATANLNIRMLPGHSIDELMGNSRKSSTIRKSNFNWRPIPAKMRRLRTLRRPCSRRSSASRRRNFPARLPCHFLAPAPRTPPACACTKCRRTACNRFR